MSITLLKPGGLYILLFSTETGGHKYHIKSPGTGSVWIADHGPTGGILKEFLLIGLFRIADVPLGSEWETHVDKTLRTFDTDLNRPGMTCKVWVLEVLELLQKATKGYTVLKCNDLKALKREAKDWGNIYALDAANNVQPRPVAASQICNL